jgi:fructosamine-3-kinase
MARAAISDPLATRIELALGERPLSLAPMGGGSVAEVYRARFANGADLAIKCGGSAEALELEAYMLRYLARHSALPVPRLRHADATMLAMDYIEAGDPLDEAAELHAAELIAALHAIEASHFGHERDTVIAGLPQPNPASESWRDFFRDRRLLHMAGLALAAGRIQPALMARIERFAARLGEFIENSARPSLIHGDLWAGNILALRGRVVGLIDPAIYYADAEIELAFATLFASVGETFFRRYDELRPLRPGFFEARREIYNLYPLLVHARLFGGHYPQAIERTLARFGA